MKNRIIIAIRLLTGRPLALTDWLCLNGTHEPNMNQVFEFLELFSSQPEAKLGHRTKKHQYVDFQLKLMNISDKKGRLL